MQQTRGILYFSILMAACAGAALGGENKLPFITANGTIKSAQLTESVSIPAAAKPYTMDGAIKRDTRANQPVDVAIEAGCEFQGKGVFGIFNSASLTVKGTRDKPVIFRSIRIDFSGPTAFTAEYAIFDSCYFGFSYFQHRGVFKFKSCVFHKCKFNKMPSDPKDGARYKLNMQECAILGTPWPGFSLPAENLDHANELQKEWSTISGCVFADSDINPTVFWASVNSNYHVCKFITEAPFQSETGLKVEAFVAEPNAAVPKNATSKPVEVTLAKKAYPFPSLPAKCPIPEAQKYFRFMYASEVPR